MDMTLARWALSFLHPYRGRVLAVAALALAEIGLVALSPWPLKVVVDNILGGLPVPRLLSSFLPPGVSENAVALLFIIVAAGLLIQVASQVARMVNTQLQIDMGQRIVYDLRSRLLAHLQALPLRHHVLTRTASSVYRLDADAYCVDNLIIGGVFPLGLAVFNLSLMFFILLYLDITLALLSLIVAPFLYVCLRYYSRILASRAEKVKGLESSLIGRAFETLSAVAAVKTFAREQHELERFSRAGDDTMRARLELTWQESTFSVAVGTITVVGTALVLFVGGLHVLDGALTVGGLLVVIAYLGAVYSPMASIAHTTGSLQQAIVSARRVGEIFAITPEPPDAPDAVSASSIAGHLRFETVSFAYSESHPVLDGVSFAAHPGDMVALVGLSGAGKTTIASLIPRLFEPSSGRVLVDERDVSDYALRSLRERVAFVPQQPVLFAGTIAENIRYGRLDATDAEVQAAAQAAHAHAFVERLPSSYNTLVAEGGVTLSGGERQRLGIARAFLKDAPILVLDEPTSAMDAISEAEVFEALRHLRAGRTILVIAHRLSTVRHATRILVLHEGRLDAQGTHDELIASCDLYRRMCARLSVGRTLDEPASLDELLEV